MLDLQISRGEKIDKLWRREDYLWNLRVISAASHKVSASIS